MALDEFKSRLRYEADLASLSLWERIFLTFEEPASSRLSQHVTIVVMSVILYSSICFVLESEPAYLGRAPDCDETCDCATECRPQGGTVFYVRIRWCIR